GSAMGTPKKAILPSMAESSGFLDYATELCSLIGPVRARSMFGGHGLYLRDLMFGLVDDDEIFLKTDAESRPQFVAAGCRPWVYTGRNGPQETSYFRPPDEAHESPEDMLPWARLALEAATRARAAKAGKGSGAKSKSVTKSKSKSRGSRPAK